MSTYRKPVDVNELRQQAWGQWLEIIPSLAPGMFDNALKKLGTHVNCPLHGGEEDFRFVKKAKTGKSNTAEVGVAMCSCGPFHDGFALLQRANGWSFPETLSRVDEWLNGSSYRPQPVAPVVRQASKEDDAAQLAKIRESFTNLWKAGKPLDLKSVPYYLERGMSARILGDMQDTRFIASLGYYEEVEEKGASKLVKTGSYPAILALMRDADGNPVAVHRTWLSKDRREKAPVRKAKKLSRATDAAGAAIRLYDAEGSDTLGITEGVENGHAAKQLAKGRFWRELGDIPVWATYSERNIRNFVIPPKLLPTLRKIVIFADNDPNGTGLAAAMEFKERMSIEHPEIEVDIKVPDVVGMDWNDVLVSL